MNQTVGQFYEGLGRAIIPLTNVNKCARLLLRWYKWINIQSKISINSFPMTMLAWNGLKTLSIPMGLLVSPVVRLPNTLGYLTYQFIHVIVVARILTQWSGLSSKALAHHLNSGYMLYSL